MPGQPTAHGRSQLPARATCSNCFKPINVHQQVRGGTCDDMSCLDLGPSELISIYEDAIPEHSVDGSCIFHGDHGCALPRELRSGICNNYLCLPMQAWLGRPASAAQLTAVIVLDEDRVVSARLITRDQLEPDIIPAQPE